MWGVGGVGDGGEIGGRGRRLSWRCGLFADVHYCEDEALGGGGEPGASRFGVGGPDGAGGWLVEIMPRGWKGGWAIVAFVAVHDDAERAGAKQDCGERAHG